MTSISSTLTFYIYNNLSSMSPVTSMLSVSSLELSLFKQATYKSQFLFQYELLGQYYLIESEILHWAIHIKSFYVVFCQTLQNDPPQIVSHNISPLIIVHIDAYYYFFKLDILFSRILKFRLFYEKLPSVLREDTSNVVPFI